MRVGIALEFGSFDGAKAKEAILLAYGLAREWSWVHLWVNATGDGADRALIEGMLAEEGLFPHQNVRFDRFCLPEALFDVALAAKFLERLMPRMRDKRFDAILVCDKARLNATTLAAKACGSKVVEVALGAGIRGWSERAKELASSIRRERR